MPYIQRPEVPFEALAGADPAAGAEGIAYTVPAGQAWIVHSLNIQLVTDATVANRRIHLVVDDGSTIYGRWFASQVQAASLTQDYSIGLVDTGVQDNINGSLVVPLPLRLGAGHRLRTITTALQAGDNYGAPMALIERWV